VIFKMAKKRKLIANKGKVKVYAVFEKNI